MKLTGTVILAIGILMGVFTLGQYFLASSSQTPDAPSTGTLPLPMLQFLFAGIAMVVGAALMVYGGSGIIRTRNAAVRN